MPEPTKILIAIFTMDERQGWVTPQLAEFLDQSARNQKYATGLVKCHGFIPVASARNQLCRRARGSGCDWLLMLDNDMVPAMNLLDCIEGAPADAAVVVPKYWMWSGSKNRTTLCWGKESTEDGYGRLDQGFNLLTKAGTGAMFIRPECLDKVSEPWFFYSYDADGGQTSTEDIEFCIKARASGLKIYGNADHEVGHLHTVNLSAVAAMQLELEKYRRGEAESQVATAGRG